MEGGGQILLHCCQCKEIWAGICQDTVSGLQWLARHMMPPGEHGTLKALLALTGQPIELVEGLKTGALRLRLFTVNYKWATLLTFINTSSSVFIHFANISQLFDAVSTVRYAHCSSLCYQNITRSSGGYKSSELKLKGRQGEISLEHIVNLRPLWQQNHIDQSNFT